MRKLIVAEFITLDGVIQAPGAPDEDSSGGFRFGGWVAPYDDDAIDRAVHDLFAEPFELLLGRRTYDIWAAYWPNVPAGHPIADRFNRVRKHVATHRPDTLEWENSHALRGEPADAVRALQREGHGNLLTYGSGELVRQLLIAGLVDELRLMVFPIVIGRGKRLFGADALASAFTLDHSERTPGGVLITRYLRAGEVRTGAIGARDAG